MKKKNPTKHKRRMFYCIEETCILLACLLPLFWSKRCSPFWIMSISLPGDSRVSLSCTRNPRQKFKFVATHLNTKCLGYHETYLTSVLLKISSQLLQNLTERLRVLTSRVSYHWHLDSPDPMLCLHTSKRIPHYPPPFEHFLQWSPHSRIKAAKQVQQIALSSSQCLLPGDIF